MTNKPKFYNYMHYGSLYPKHHVWRNLYNPILLRIILGMYNYLSINPLFI